MYRIMSDISDQDRQTTLQHLARQLDRLERTHRRPANAAGESEAAAVSTGVEAFDRLLPGNGLAGGTLIECFATGAGSGAGTLACVLARRFVGEVGDQRSEVRGQEAGGRRQGATQGGRWSGTQCSVPSTQDSPLNPHGNGAVVVIDPHREFYPPAAVGLGLELDGTIVVRPESERDVLWALEQSLRCPGVAVTLAWLEELDGRASRRLALAVETGGGLGFLLRPATRQREPSSAHVRLLIQPGTSDGSSRPSASSLSPRPSSPPIPDSSASRRLHIHLLRGRKGHVAESLELELCDEPPDPVRLAAPLAHPASAHQATGT
jgi:protein ImuA